MSPLFDQLEDQLREAARKQVAAGGAGGRAPRWRRWAVGGRRRLPIMLGVAGTLAVVAAVVLVVALHGSGSANPAAQTVPATLSGRLQLEFKDARKATGPVLREPLCADQPAPRSRALSGQPSAALRRELAVLRTPRVAGAAPPRAVLQALDSPYYADSIRRAQVVAGVGYYVVPIRLDPAIGQPDQQCLTAESTALEREVATLAPALRAGTLRVGRTMIIAVHKLLGAKRVDEVCLVASDSRPQRGECQNMTASDISGGTTPTFLSAHGRSALVAIEPDRVTRVVVDYPSLHRSFADRVRDNVLVIPVRGAPLPEGGESVTWYNAAGTAIGGGSTAMMHEVSCSAHPKKCAALNRKILQQTSSAHHERSSQTHTTRLGPPQP